MAKLFATDNAEDMRLLNRSQCVAIPRVDDLLEYKLLQVTL